MAVVSSIVHFTLDSLKLYAVRLPNGHLDLGEGMSTPNWPRTVRIGPHTLKIAMVEQGCDNEEWALYSIPGGEAEDGKDEEALG
jgi:hypothetical protein